MKNKKICYLFDIDIIERSKYPRFPKLPNHALMKFSSYYKQKGYSIKLVYSKTMIPKYYDDNNIYIGSSLYSGNLERFKKRMEYLSKSEKHLSIDNIHIGTPLDVCPITDIKHLKCDYTEYDKMIAEDSILLEMYPSNVGYLTRGCIRHCKFCVHRNKNKITRVNDINEIYVNKGKPIYLLDDNIMASDDAVELFNQIYEFGKRNKDVEIYLQNGLDARVLKKDKLFALVKASKYIVRIYAAWDDVKNSFIYKNICILKHNLHSHIGVYCLIGDNIFTEEQLKLDLLGFFYRCFLLLKINVRPVIQVYEDDENIYVNPYIELYKVIERQYTFLRLGSYQTIYRKLPPNYVEFADEIVRVLGEYSWLVETNTGDILNDPLFFEKMQSIADELKIKHYNPPKKLLNNLKKKKEKKKTK